jgi:hypothetical protein
VIHFLTRWGIKLRWRFIIGRLLLAHVTVLSGIAAAQAQSRDPELTLESNGGEIVVEAKGASLGEIMDRLFIERGTVVEWQNKALAGKVIQGSFKGPIDDVTQRLLAGLSYFAVSEHSDGETRITRVVILGGASPLEMAPQTPVAARAGPNSPAPPKLPVKAARFGPKIYK